jgi:hypothetical protein
MITIVLTEAQHRCLLDNTAENSRERIALEKASRVSGMQNLPNHYVLECEEESTSILPMQLQLGDRYSDETGEWEAVSRPVSFRGGKSFARGCRSRGSRGLAIQWRGIAAGILQRPRWRPVIRSPPWVRSLGRDYICFLPQTCVA